MRPNQSLNSAPANLLATSSIAVGSLLITQGNESAPKSIFWFFGIILIVLGMLQIINNQQPVDDTDDTILSTPQRRF